MNNEIKQAILFIFYFLLQVLILNNINLFGYANPYLYIMFVIFFPFKKNKFPILTLAFLLGLGIDFFTDTGGINAFATLSIAYIRPFFLTKIFQTNEEESELLNPDEESYSKSLYFTSILTFIHHFILFCLINFSFDNFIENVVINTILSTFFTLILHFLVNFIFRRSKD